MALSCIVYKIYRVIGRKSRNFYTPPVFSAPARCHPVGISRRRLLLIKPEWLGYRVLQKLLQYVKPFRHNTGTWRTDGQTDRQNCYINIDSVNVLTRDDNSKYRSPNWPSKVTQGHRKCHGLTERMISYYRSIVTTALSCIVSDYSKILVELREIKEVTPLEFRKEV